MAALAGTANACETTALADDTPPPGGQASNFLPGVPFSDGRAHSPSRHRTASARAAQAVVPGPRPYHSGMDALTWFGLVAVSLMLLFYALERRSSVFVLAFAGACVLGSAYGFLQGAWPFGVVEAVWSLVALRRWRQAARSRGERMKPRSLPSLEPPARPR
jgi:hypothetical protein